MNEELKKELEIKELHSSIWYDWVKDNAEHIKNDILSHPKGWSI
ncbi:MAG: hypothetical protein WC346_09140 [Methanogenium sp.]|jgi:hypothetical protein